jgi:hypothetical protein
VVNALQQHSQTIVNDVVTVEALCRRAGDTELRLRNGQAIPVWPMPGPPFVRWRRPSARQCSGWAC